MDTLIKDKLNTLVNSFQKVLYEDDEIFLENMKKNNLSGDDISKYRFWEWTQGVGLFGFWKLFEQTHEEAYLNILLKYYDEQLANGLPSKNINTVTPLLTLIHIYEYTKNEKYLPVCIEWADWIMTDLPKTKEGGFQHLTSDTLNEGELWDDTLFMTVLFLAKIGQITHNNAYIEEAEYQFLLHIKYLSDKKTGLWYHGFTFKGAHNFAEAFWGRGNCWVTMAIPEFIEITHVQGSTKRFLVNALNAQIESLEKFQAENGMWHTLVDDSTSYVEASATCGFAYGILKSIELGLVADKYNDCALKALSPILELITEEGIVSQVSYGTPMGRLTKDFYKEIPIHPMPYGQALAILFLMQASK